MATIELISNYQLNYDPYPCKQPSGQKQNNTAAAPPCRKTTNVSFRKPAAALRADRFQFNYWKGSGHGQKIDGLSVPGSPLLDRRTEGLN